MLSRLYIENSESVGCSGVSLYRSEVTSSGVLHYGDWQCASGKRPEHLYFALYTADGFTGKGGGLSSSAAMVVASSLATLEGYSATSSTTQGELAEIAIDGERAVGVNSGGMDQSASIFSKKNNLLNMSVHFL